MSTLIRRWTPRHGDRQLHPTCALCDQSMWKHVIQQARLGLPTFDLPCPEDAQ